MGSQFGFDKILKNMEEVKKTLPPILANQAQNHFVAAFSNEGFDEGQNKWKEVKRRQEGTPEYKYPKKKGLSRRTKPILSGTGKLKKAVGNSIKEATFDRIRLAVSDTAVPYAGVHNDGGEAGRGHAAHIPQRQFIGHSEQLGKMQKEKIEQVIDKIWNE